MTEQRDPPGGTRRDRRPDRRPDRLRRWLREIGSIVLGVLIALALGAVASEIGWRLEVRSARQSLAEEMGELLGQARLRERAEGCYKAKLDRLARVLDAAEADGRLPPIADVGQPSFLTWSSGVWQSTLSAQTAAHFDRDELDNLSGAYEFAALLSRLGGQEMDRWSELSTMVGPGRRLGEEEAARLRAALSGARSASNLIALTAVRVQQLANAYRLPYDQGTFAEYGEGPLSAVRMCQPLAAFPPPATYGAGVLEGGSARARATPIARQD